MKVAFAHYSDTRDIGGVTSWIVPLAKRLQSDGVEVAMHLHHLDINPQQATILPELSDSGIHVVSACRKRRLASDVRQTLAFLNDWQPTVFLPQCLPAHFVAAAIAGVHGLPWALTIHSDDPAYWAVARSLPPPGYGGSTVSVSEHIANLVRETAIDPHPTVIPYGITIPPRNAAFSQQPFRVAYCGRLVEHQKRMSLVIDTLIRACHANPAIAVTVIGDGYSRAACEREVENAGLAHAFHFTGRLTNAEVQAVLGHCQATLLMSDFEGLPVALLEAMALGVVPVCRAIPSGIPELVDHGRTGLLVSDGPQVAAEAILRLAGDPSLWQRCSMAAHEHVAGHYNDSLCYARWRQLIDELDRASTINYPITGRWPVRLRKLDPQLFGGYRQNPSLVEQVRRRVRTSTAQLKHRARLLLAPHRNSSQ